VTFNFTDASGANISLTANVQVVSGGYFQSDNILVTGDSSLLLDPAVEEAELATLRSVMLAFNPERYFSGTFGLPAAATITSGSVSNAHLTQSSRCLVEWGSGKHWEKKNSAKSSQSDNQ